MVCTLPNGLTQRDSYRAEVRAVNHEAGTVRYHVMECIDSDSGGASSPPRQPRPSSSMLSVPRPVVLL
jgi:hypothetical protein